MTDQPEGQRWVIHVCEECGDYGLVFGSEHSIPLTCPEPGEDHPDGRHRGPYRKVEVIPASSAASEADPALGFSKEEIERMKSGIGHRIHCGAIQRRKCDCGYVELFTKLRRSLEARK